ncbi:glycoside hydrolase [Thozetella sp. PMI_491]|nr:glycoside hydrolase [Thozetella sp. PMI_491]
MSAALGLKRITSTVSSSTPQDPDYTCAPDRPCAVGCCGPFGICGMGPDFCDPAVCVNSCDAKAECDPANWGPQYTASEGCPLNVCCSKFGFCGTTPEFCGDLTIQNPSCPGGGSANQRTIGYYEGWSPTRQCDPMYPESIQIGTYTHLNFAFATINPDTFAIEPSSPDDIDLYRRLTGLKQTFPNLQVWISIGGWSMNDPDQPTATTFSDLASSNANQAAFFASLASFMSTYGFDGVDIDWEYPVAPERSGRPEDFANYPILLQNLRSAFNTAGHSYGLSITLPSSFWYLQNFDIVKLEPIVDWFNMMAYVFAHTNLTEIDQSLKLLWRNNISPSKVVLGLGFYGRSFALQDPSCSDPGCPFTGGAPAGACTNSIGTLSFAEVQDIIAEGGQVRLDDAAAVKIVTYGDGNWVSYDDADTLTTKVAFANENCLGGTMVWAVSLDDPAGTAARALGTASGKGSSNYHVGIVNVGVGDRCVWTSCTTDLASCPIGSTAVFAAFEGCPVTIPTSGLDSSKVPRRLFCCPANEVPTCRKSGTINDQRLCTPLPCNDGETLVGTTQSILLTVQCNRGQLNRCCQTNTAIANTVSGCSWTGGSPLCAPSGQSAACGPGTVKLVSASHGDGGSEVCTNGQQSLCCPSPLAFDSGTCRWYTNSNLDGFCQTGCPPGKVELAIDNQAGNCVFGYASFCCSPPLTGTESVSTAQLVAFRNTLNDFLDGGAVCDLNDPYLMQLGEGYEGATLYRGIWNNAILTRPLVNINFDDLVPELGPSNRGIDDPVRVTNGILCLGQNAGQVVRGDRASVAELCTIDVEDTFIDAAAVQKRSILGGWEASTLIPGAPTAGNILSAILQQQLRFEYFRWFAYMGTAVELEVAWLVGQDPTHMNSGLQQHDTDHFVILHIHFARNNFNGHMIPSGINLRHATNIRARNEAGEPTPGAQSVTGRWRVSAASAAEAAFPCEENRGVELELTPDMTGSANDQVLRILQHVRTFGSNGDLFSGTNSDISTLVFLWMSGILRYVESDVCDEGLVRDMPSGKFLYF